MFSKSTVLTVVTALALALGGAAAALADEAKGTGDRPAGWDKGKKEGWQGNTPPGLEKKGGVPPGQKKKQDGAGKPTTEKKPDAKEPAPATTGKKDAGVKLEKKKKEKKTKPPKQKDAAPK